MRTDELETIQQELESEKIRLSELLDRTGKNLYRREEPYPADFADQVSETENHQVVEALDQGARQELVQIQRALERIKSGAYGKCTTCGASILEARLKAIPYTELCNDCAS